MSEVSVRPQFVVVGIGADGWAGLGRRAQDELVTATVIYGARRQLDLLDDVDAELIAWDSPMSAHLARVLDEPAYPVVHILASGDPMFHGVGATIVKGVGAERTRVLPAVSSASLACAHLGWDLTSVRVVSLVTADPASLLTESTHGQRLLVLSRDAHTPAAVAALLGDNGFGSSTLTVLEQLGGPRERVISGTAGVWAHAPGDPLNVIAVECVGPPRTTVPGRADTDFVHDGQITKSAHRALTVCALEPAGAQMLWDIGAGSGSVGVEWVRADPRGRVVAFERDPQRAERIAQNAHRHGVGAAISVHGCAPESLSGAPTPDAVFIGGGLTGDVLRVAYDALRIGGRLVVNAVTVESQTLLAEWHRTHGGQMRRVMIESAEPLGSMTTWRPALPIVQWIHVKAAKGKATDLNEPQP